MKEILLDTSSIIFGLANKIDTFQILKESFPTYRITIPLGVIRELKGFAKGKKKEKLQAKIGLALLEKYKIHVVKNNEYVDNWIFKNADNTDVIVCTNDVELKHRLKETGAKTISLSRSGLLR